MTTARVVRCCRCVSLCVCVCVCVRPLSLSLSAPASVSLFMRTCRVESTRPPAATGTSDPANTEVSSGVMIGAAHVLTVVIKTDRATSAFAIKVTRLLAVPLMECVCVRVCMYMHAHMHS